MGIEHFDMNQRAAKVIAQARFKVGDVVTTEKKVTAYDNRGKKDGWADPGWAWRVTDQLVEWRGMSCTITYKVTAHDAPGFYFQHFRDSQIAGKVGEHKGEKFGPKEPVAAAAS